jgi:hypothetical protein
MLDQPVSVYLGVDGSGRRQSLTALLDASFEFDLIGASEAGDECLRAVVVNRPRLLVLAGHPDDPPARLGELIGRVRQGSPTTSIVALGVAPEGQPPSDPRTAERYLAPIAPLTEIYAGILVAARQAAARPRVPQASCGDSPADSNAR